MFIWGQAACIVGWQFECFLLLSKCTPFSRHRLNESSKIRAAQQNFNQSARNSSASVYIAFQTIAFECICHTICFIRSIVAPIATRLSLLFLSNYFMALCDFVVCLLHRNQSIIRAQLSLLILRVIWSQEKKRLKVSDAVSEWVNDTEGERKSLVALPCTSSSVLAFVCVTVVEVLQYALS